MPDTAVTVTEEQIRAIVREEIEAAMDRDPSKKKAAIIASKGTLDWAYPPFILATAAAAAGMETSVFFTFYGLNLIRKGYMKKIKVSPVANPAMPMPVPMPDLVTALPGMQTVATSMMKSMFDDKGVAKVQELIDAALELDVNLIACQMTMDVFGYEQDEFIDGVQFGGAAAFLSEARKGHVTLFI
ncbi:MAG: DsrE/DsrF/DrsH-like family protein [Longimicrobiales bacterium]|nr:DsrE/DsrF/DrsH-like family protein [Longimicrobiales bacterium]